MATLIPSLNSCLGRMTSGEKRFARRPDPTASNPASRRMLMRTLAARNWRLSSVLAVALLGFSTAQAQVSKWVDEKGIVHYGDVVPDKYRGGAKAMPLRNDAPSPAEVKAAQLRLQKIREPQRATSSASEPASPAIADSPAPQEQTQTVDLSCDGQWKRYFAAQDCFGPYHNANGSVRVEALSHCPIINEPMGCTAPRTRER